MIIFVDPTNTYMNWWPIVEEQRQHAPTLLVPMPWKNLTTSRVFSDTFWNKYIQKRDRKMNQRRKQKRGTNVYKVWNQKFIFMREAARANPFDTEFFYWIDAGYIRNSAHSLRCTPLVRNNITESSAVDPRTQLVYHMIHEYPTYEIAGGAWGGSSKAIQLHYHHYWRTFWYLVLYSDKECPGYEQRVQVWMCRSFPELCVINRSRFWFEMGLTWLRKEEYDFSKKSRIIPVDNTTTLPPLTEDFKIKFPLNASIEHIPEIPKGQLSLEQSMGYTHFLVGAIYE